MLLVLFFSQELQCGDVPHILTLIDGQKGDNQICVGYQKQYDLINEKNGDTLQLYNVEAAKVNLVAALDIYEDDEAELILCYNRKLFFIHFCSKSKCFCDILLKEYRLQK